MVIDGETGDDDLITVKANKFNGNVINEYINVAINNVGVGGESEMEAKNLEPMRVGTRKIDLGASCRIRDMDEPGKRFIGRMNWVLFKS